MTALKSIPGRRIGNLLTGTAVALNIGLMSLADPAQAAPVTFVSGNGNNANNCLTPATACRQIGGPTGALFKTDIAGTIHVLPGAYQPFDINFPIMNIIADQGQASINGSIETASSVAVGRASILVNSSGGPILQIRGFTFAVQDSGIGIYGGGDNSAVHIDNCIFNSGTGFANAGVETAVSGPVEISISNSRFRGPGQAILIKPPAGGSAQVVLDNVNIENASFGLNMDARATNGVNRVTVRDTTIANGGAGIFIIENTTGSTRLAVENTNISNIGSSAALSANGATITARVQDSMIVNNNGTGVAAINGAQVISHGGNVLAGNFNNGAFTSTVPSQ